MIKEYENKYVLKKKEKEKKRLYLRASRVGNMGDQWRMNGHQWMQLWASLHHPFLINIGGIIF